MTGYNAFCWVVLLLVEIHTVSPLFIVASYPARNSCVKCADKTVGSSEKEDTYFESETLSYLWNTVLTVLSGVKETLWTDSTFLLLFTEISPYGMKLWRHLPFQKEEEKIVLPPPEDSLLDKMSKRILPGINCLKNIPKSIGEITGFTLSRIVTVIILSVFNASVATVIYVYLAEDAEEGEFTDEKREFTDEELLEDYEYNPEFRNELYEWLTPTRHSKYTAEDDDFMNAKDVTFSEACLLAGIKK